MARINQQRLQLTLADAPLDAQRLSPSTDPLASGFAAARVVVLAPRRDRLLVVTVNRNRKVQSFQEANSAEVGRTRRP